MTSKEVKDIARELAADTARERKKRAERNAKYRKSPKGKVAQTEARKRYCQTEKGREVRKRNR